MIKKYLLVTSIVSILMFSSTTVFAKDIREGFDCPCMVKAIHGTVMMVDRNNKPIKQYPQVMNRDNKQLYQTQDEIYVLRKNKQVSVYDIQTGNLIRSYYAPNLNNWVR